jgi:hypothetical protein
MNRTPTRFAGPTQVATGPATVVTADELSVVRYVHIHNPTGGAVTFDLSIGNDGASTRLYDNESIPAGAAFTRHVFWVLNDNDVIQMAASSNNVLVASFHGDEYTP